MVMTTNQWLAPINALSNAELIDADIASEIKKHTK
jgi:hypothetical protein